MSYNPIPDEWREPGKALKRRVLDRISDNLEDHEERINEIELGAGRVIVFDFEVVGNINELGPNEMLQISTHRAANSFNIVSLTMIIINGPQGPASSDAGDLEIDIEKSEDNGITWNSLFTSRPIVFEGPNSGDAGTIAQAPTFVTGGESVEAGDLLRFNITSLKDTQGSFMVSCFGEIS